MEPKIIYVDDFYMTGTLRFYTNGQIGVSTNRESSKYKRKKYVAINSGDCYNTFNYIANKTYVSPDYCAGDHVWVHPNARLSRDLIRKSGYSITRDKEKAEFIVIPEPDYNQFSDITYHISCLDGNTLYFFTVSDSYQHKIPENKFELAQTRIRDFLDNPDVEFLCDDMYLKTACFFPPVEEYKNLLEENIKAVVVFDTKIKLQPNVDINVETLDVWRRLDDMNMLSIFVCASDWKEYPLTVKLFLEEYKYSIKYQINNHIKMIIRELNIGESISPNMVITQKDLNMLYSWIFHIIGKSNGATYITEEDYHKIPNKFKYLLKKRVAISPVVTARDEIFANIVNEAKN